MHSNILNILGVVYVVFFVICHSTAIDSGPLFLQSWSK